MNDFDNMLSLYKGLGLNPNHGRTDQTGTLPLDGPHKYIELYGGDLPAVYNVGSDEDTSVVYYFNDTTSKFAGMYVGPALEMYPIKEAP